VDPDDQLERVETSDTLAKTCLGTDGHPNRMHKDEQLEADPTG
jgi:hypothetical protein